MNKYRQRGEKYRYIPGSKEPFSLSRSKIDLFLECSRCFYLDRRLGLDRPGMPGWPLNSAVDELLKKEFDLLRKNGEAHAIMAKYKIDAVPFQHPDIDEWRANFTGRRYLHKPTNLEVFGAVDDIWVNPKGELIIVDYKATSTSKEISLDDEYKEGFKKQIEIYQWIYRQNGHKVNNTGYIVYANGIKDRDKFDGILEFEMSLHPHKGDDSWVEPTIFAVKECLEADTIPEASETCEYCMYRKLISEKE